VGDVNDAVDDDALEGAAAARVRALLLGSPFPSIAGRRDHEEGSTGGVEVSSEATRRG
jgi:hypothetical protein